jgi:agmatinase
VADLGVAETVRRVAGWVGAGPVFVTVDVDVLDPAFAPGTGTPEPGGLSSRELLRACRALARALDVVGADVVEVSPPYDPAGATAVAGANVAYELLGLLVLSLRG